MKIALVTDTHFGTRNDSQLFLDNFMSFFEGVFFPTLKKYDIDTVIHAGDLLDRRKYINFNTLSKVRNNFMQPLKDMDIKVHCILGNHDTYYKNTNDLNSIKELFSDRYDNFKLYENPVTLEFDGMEIALLPWINNENYKNSMDFVNSTSAQWLVGHLELDGYEVLRGIKYDGGMSPKNFSRFEQVLSGHFHCKQEKGNIIYLGAPYQITFSDVNEPKGFWILDTDTRELEFIKNEQKLFYTLSYDDTKYDYSKFITENHSKYRDTYVKIYVINKEKPYILDRVIDSLYNSGVYDLSIVEDVDNTIINSIDNQKADITKSTLELIYEEVDNLEDIKDSNIVKQLIKELYMESLTV
jgi:DNA repair exonuclease SbcCD nuclease subunit